MADEKKDIRPERCLACGGLVPMSDGRSGGQWLTLPDYHRLGPFCTSGCRIAAGMWTHEERLRHIFGDFGHGQELLDRIERGDIKT